MMQKKRVVIGIPVLLVGGTEIQVLTLVRVLIDAGYEATILCYYEYDKSMVYQMESVGANVKLMELKREQGLWHLTKKLIKSLKEINPNIVHVQYLAPGLMPIIAARLAGIKTVFATVHIAGSIAYGWKAKALLRVAANLCTIFFCVSRGVEEFWFGDSEVFDPGRIVPRRKHYTIYNAIDITKITEMVRSIDKEKAKSALGIEGRPVIGIVGRLAKQKGHAVLLNTMVEVVKKIPDVILVVIGDGPERRSLEQIAESLKIEKNIRWLGARKQEEVFKLYSIMDVFVMPSLYEGFGLTAAEAMATGLPVVGANIEGLSEIIEDGITGYLVPTGDSTLLAERMVELLRNHDKTKEMGTQGQKRAIQLFSLELFRESILGAYKHLSKRQARA